MIFGVICRAARTAIIIVLKMADTVIQMMMKPQQLQQSQQPSRNVTINLAIAVVSGTHKVMMMKRLNTSVVLNA